MDDHTHELEVIDDLSQINEQKEVKITLQCRVWGCEYWRIDYYTYDSSITPDGLKILSKLK
jgi:hypothetical protein